LYPTPPCIDISLQFGRALAAQPLDFASVSIVIFSAQRLL
jgi:hypothetical protein